VPAAALLVLADHEQFYVQDLDAHGAWMRIRGGDPDLPPAGWSHDAVHLHRIGVEPHSISVGTARSDVVETMLEFHPAAPEPLLGPAEHVVEADLDCPNGVLSVYGPADDPGQERRVTTPGPGLYRVRVSYLPAEPPGGFDEDAYGGHFLYRIDLWPAEERTGLAILKQGPRTWGG
jgi:hypothetical protein